MEKLKYGLASPGKHSGRLTWCWVGVSFLSLMLRDALAQVRESGYHSPHMLSSWGLFARLCATRWEQHVGAVRTTSSSRGAASGRCPKIPGSVTQARPS